MVDLEFSFGGPIVFSQVLQHKYLKTAQFTNLDARIIGCPGPTAPLKPVIGDGQSNIRYIKSYIFERS